MGNLQIFFKTRRDTEYTEGLFFNTELNEGNETYLGHYQLQKNYLYNNFFTNETNPKPFGRRYFCNHGHQSHMGGDDVRGFYIILLHFPLCDILLLR